MRRWPSMNSSLEYSCFFTADLSKAEILAIEEAAAKGSGMKKYVGLGSNTITVFLAFVGLILIARFFLV